MKVKVSDGHCKGCVWLVNKSVCAFNRCVNRLGWSEDKRVK